MARVMTDEHKAKLAAGRKERKEKAPLTHTVRTRDGKTVEIENYTRGMAVKLMCTECMGFEGSEVAKCSDPLCPLYPFRKMTRLAYGDGPMEINEIVENEGPDDEPIEDDDEEVVVKKSGLLTDDEEDEEVVESNWDNEDDEE